MNNAIKRYFSPALFGEKSDNSHNNHMGINISFVIRNPLYVHEQDRDQKRKRVSVLFDISILTES